MIFLICSLPHFRLVAKVFNMKNLLAKNLTKKKLVWNFASPQQNLIDVEGLPTVCKHSRCPNRAECSFEKTATFMIGGEDCTRNCLFCHVTNKKPQPMSVLMQTELEQLNHFFSSHDLKHVVLTSVTRDDDPQALAEHFSNATSLIHDYQWTAELLIPDFRFNKKHLDIVLSSKPEVISHNIETVERLSPIVRPQANYQRSLDVLDYFSQFDIIKKSGFMVGMGETFDEINLLLADLESQKVDIVTIGQYLQPSNKQLKVQHFYTDEDWERIRVMSARYAFSVVEYGTYVRSSYKAYSSYVKAKQNANTK